MRLLEDGLAEEGIGNANEIKRRAGRSGAPPTGDRDVSTQPRWAECLGEWLQRVTQRGVKFIRCASPAPGSMPVGWSLHPPAGYLRKMLDLNFGHHSRSKVSLPQVGKVGINARGRTRGAGHDFRRTHAATGIVDIRPQPFQ